MSRTNTNVRKIGAKEKSIKLAVSDKPSNRAELNALKATKSVSDKLSNRDNVVDSSNILYIKDRKFLSLIQSIRKSDFFGGGNVKMESVSRNKQPGEAIKCNGRKDLKRVLASSKIIRFRLLVLGELQVLFSEQ